MCRCVDDLTCLKKKKKEKKSKTNPQNRALKPLRIENEQLYTATTPRTQVTSAMSFEKVASQRKPKEGEFF